MHQRLKVNFAVIGLGMHQRLKVNFAVLVGVGRFTKRHFIC